jgi:hypothetical protein
MFNLAVNAGKLMTRPVINMKKDANIRQGFFEPDQMAEVLNKLPPDLRAPVEFAYLTGWRLKSEVLSVAGITNRDIFTASISRITPAEPRRDRGPCRRSRRQRSGDHRERSGDHWSPPSVRGIVCVP